MRVVKRTGLAAALCVLAAVVGCGRSHLAFFDDERDAGTGGAVGDAGGDAGQDGVVADASAGGGMDAGGIDASVMADASIGDAGADAASDAGVRDASVDAALHEPDAAADFGSTEIAANLRLAFFGDQGYGVDAEAVLQLVKSERADLVIHAGDLDYLEQPLDWEGQVDSVLGHDFPYFVAIGNHDIPAWPGPDGYQELIAARLARVPGAQCSGDTGVNSVCTYRGLAFVLSGVGTYGEDHESYLSTTLAALPHAWKICAWHKNQRDMQVGAKGDEVGWRAYRLCEAHGALILTGHEHSYSRTYTLSGVGYPEIAHGFHGSADRVVLEPGSTAVVVSGLGGRSARVFYAELHPDISWWASIYARNYQQMNGVETGVLENIEFGALFVDFHIEGDPNKARAYFKTVSGAVVDSFEIAVVP